MEALVSEVRGLGSGGADWMCGCLTNMEEVRGSWGNWGHVLLFVLFVRV